MRKWFKLDTAGLIFPATMNRKWANAFRVSAQLSEPVDPQILQQAVNDLARRFPSFYVRLSAGLFWFRLEESRSVPVVSEDYAFPLVHMTRKELRRSCMRILYYRSRIAVECFHSISDGTGGIIFLKNLLRRYIHLKYDVTCDDDMDLKDLTQEPQEYELEDSFFRHAAPFASKERDPKAFKNRGSTSLSGKRTLITGTLPTDDLLRVSHEYGCSVTCFLSAVMLQALIDVQNEAVPKKRQKPVQVTVPVNLRRLFGSMTLRNFVLTLNVGVDPRLGEYSLRDLCETARHQVYAKATPQFMSGMIAENTLPQSIMALRLVPLFVKNIVMRFVYSYRGERGGSINVSNVGVEKLPPELSRYVKRLDFVIGAQKSYPNNCSVVSYEGRTMINIIREIDESTLERLFFSRLVELGIPVEIESNED